MAERKTIFDDIIDCIQRETSEVGTVFVRKKDRMELEGSLQQSVVQTAKPPPPVIHHTEPAEPEFIPQSSHTVRKVAPVEPCPPLSCVPPPDVSGYSMEQLLEAVRKCQGCRLAGTRTNTVFSDGDPHAELMFIGEGPGEDEDLQGVPFVGRAGQLLTKMIAAMTLDRKRVYIANIVKCRPPGNRNPADDEAAVCLPYLKRQIELVQPKVIILLGAVPLKFLLGMTGITRMRGKWLEYNGIPVMPTFHPSYLLRVPSSKRDAWQDLQTVMAKLGITK